MYKDNLTSEQQRVFDQLLYDIQSAIQSKSHFEVILCGSAGTGKTYLLTAIIEQLLQSHSVTITAPTHKALSVVQTNLSHLQHKYNLVFQTLQSYLNIKLDIDYSTGESYYEIDTTKMLRNTDILIIDEASMVSEELYTQVKSALLKSIVKAVVFVGDDFQLLPVDGQKNVLLIEGIKRYTLHEVMRQSNDSYILEVATQIRDIIEHQKEIGIEDFLYQHRHIGIEFFYDEQSFYEDFYASDNWHTKQQIVACYTNKCADRYNKIIKDYYWKDKTQKQSFYVGEKLIVQEGFKTFNNEILLNNQEIVLAFAQKQLLKNTNIAYWICKDKFQNSFFIIDPQYNDTFATLLDSIVHNIRTSQNADKKALWEEFFRFKYSFLKVKPPYATTIHKLQGSTYETVYLDVVEILKSGNHMRLMELYRLLYVAVTRASKSLKVLLPISFWEEKQLIEKGLDSLLSIETSVPKEISLSSNGIQKGSVIREAINQIPTCAGIYKIFISKEGLSYLRDVNPTTTELYGDEEVYLLYIGTAKNMQERLKWHLGMSNISHKNILNATVSTFRVSLMANHVSLNDLSKQEELNKFMDQYLFFKYMCDENFKEIELKLLQRDDAPLNIKDNQHEFVETNKRRRKELKQKYSKMFKDL